MSSTKPAEAITAFEADRRNLVVAAGVVRQIGFRSTVDSGPEADEVRDGFGFKFLDFGSEAAAIRPPLCVGCAEVSTIQVREFVDHRGEAGFTTEVSVDEEFIPNGHLDETRLRTPARKVNVPVLPFTARMEPAD